MAKLAEVSFRIDGELFELQLQIKKPHIKKGKIFRLPGIKTDN